MQAQLLTWADAVWKSDGPRLSTPQLVVGFGPRAELERGEAFSSLVAQYRTAEVLACSTGGQISKSDVTDEATLALAFQFDATTIKLARADCSDVASSRDVGRGLAHELCAPGLRGVLLLTNGLYVNGSALIDGMVGVLGADIPVFGGMAGDGPDFLKTIVCAGDAASEFMCGAVGFYGDKIRLGFGSDGGWVPFGLPRKITKSEGSILYELDGKCALDLYERYAGPTILANTGVGLRYPLQITAPGIESAAVVRTILSTDAETRSIQLAGSVPEGWTAQLMRTSFDGLSAAAARAANSARSKLGDVTGQTASLLVSCIGRRLLMGENIADEVTAATWALGEHNPHLGFYSYGEFAPLPQMALSRLHNQTMTILTIGEVT